MGRFQDGVAAGVDQFLLRPGEVAPEQENQSLPLLRQGADDRIGEFSPADPAVGSGLSGPHGQHGIEQENALGRPAAERTVLVQRYTQVRFNLLVDIDQRAR